jgi:hypothetical protein
LNAAALNITGQMPLRAEIRGAVTVNPPTPAANPVAPGFCSVMVTLEVFDNTTGNTVVLTTDARVIGIVPLLTRER